MRRLYLTCTLLLGINAAQADTVYINDLNLQGGTTTWYSQAYTFAPGTTVDFGTVTLYPYTPVCNAYYCQTAAPPAYLVEYRPVTQDILYSDGYILSGFGAIATCWPPCTSEPKVFHIEWTLPPDQNTLSLVVMSYFQPPGWVPTDPPSCSEAIICPQVPLPATLPLFASGLAVLTLIGKRRRRYGHNTR